MQRLINNVKEMRPLPVAVAYLVMGGALLLLARVAFSAVAAPIWALRLLFAVLAITFPFVIVLAWALSSGPPVGVRVQRQRRVGDPS